MHYSDVRNTDFESTFLQLLIFWFLLVWQLSLIVSCVRRYLISFKEVNKSVEILILTEGRGYFLVIISYIGIFVTPVFLFFSFFELFWYEIQSRLYAGLNGLVWNKIRDSSKVPKTNISGERLRPKRKPKLHKMACLR